MTGSQGASVTGDRCQSEVGSVVSYATANTNASRCVTERPLQPTQRNCSWCLASPKARKAPLLCIPGCLMQAWLSNASN